MKILTPIKAIRAKCLECSNYQPKEVRNCSIESCSLYVYRFGKNPNRIGIGKRSLDLVNKVELRA